MVDLIDFLIFSLNAENQQRTIHQNKNRGHQTSKIVKSRQRYRNGHLPYHCLFYYILSARIDAYMTYVACEFACTIAINSAKYQIQKPSTCRETLFRCKFWVDVSRFSPCVINFSRNKNMCCRLKEFVAKSRSQVHFEQQTLAVFTQDEQIC